MINITIKHGVIYATTRTTNARHGNATRTAAAIYGYGAPNALPRSSA
jgi:hypothetical protein